MIIIRANSSSAGYRLRITDGRTLAASPRSTCQTSPSFARGILCLHAVQDLEVLVSAAIAVGQQLRLILHLKYFARDLATLFGSQTGKLSDDFLRAHCKQFRICGTVWQFLAGSYI